MSLGHIGNHLGHKSAERLQSGIHTLAQKKLWRLGRPSLSVCTDKLILNADKNADKMDF